MRVPDLSAVLSPDDLTQKVAQLPSLAKPSLPKLQAQPFCGNIKDEDKTAQETAVCAWNMAYDGVKSNVTDAEWALGLDFNTTENVDDVVSPSSAAVNICRYFHRAQRQILTDDFT